MVQRRQVVEELRSVSPSGSVQTGTESLGELWTQEQAFEGLEL